MKGYVELQLMWAADQVKNSNAAGWQVRANWEPIETHTQKSNQTTQALELRTWAPQANTLAP